MLGRHDTAASGTGAVAIGRDNHGSITTNVTIGLAPGGVPYRSGYLDRVRELGPSGPLLDRAAELNELAEFCHGPDPYVHWQGELCAGKTALLSTFVLDPPEDVDVVSFFVTARLAGQATSESFTDAMLEQLAALCGETLTAHLTTGSARDAARRRLLEHAMQRAEEAGRRLVLVVDGLDEDVGAVSGSGMASIAALLPDLPGTRLRVVVASRAGAGLFADVPARHPLRRCRVRTLNPSPHAREIAERAQQELDDLLAGPVTGRDIVGLLAASGGGVSLDDLEELTDLAPYELEQILAGPARRTIAHHATEPAVFLFAHETLRTTAMARFGRSLGRFTVRIHEWADSYRDRGWPPDTPPYLLSGYLHRIQESADLDRLVELTTDAARHGRMLVVTGGDAAAVAELRITQSAVIRDRPDDVATMLRLAVYRCGLASRTANMPAALPSVWALLGQPARAEALARGFGDNHNRALALSGLAEALAGLDQLDHAVELAREAHEVLTFTYRAGDKAEALRRLVTVANAIGDEDWAASLEREASRHEPAETVTLGEDDQDDGGAAAAAVNMACRGYFGSADHLVATSVRRPGGRDDVRRTLVAIAAEQRSFPWAEALADRILDTATRRRAIASLADAWLREEHYACAAKTAHAVQPAGQRAETLVELVRVLADQGQSARALALAKRAAVVIYDAGPTDRPRMLAQLIEVTAGLDGGVFARRLLARVDDPRHRADALVRMARSIASGAPSEAADLLDQAEVEARRVVDEEEKDLVLSCLLPVLAAAGRREAALMAARAIKDDWLFGPARNLGRVAPATVVEAIGRHNDITFAYEIARCLPGLGGESATEAVLRMAAKSPAYRQWAETTLDRLPEDPYSERARIAVVEGLIAGGDHATAKRLVDAVDTPPGSRITLVTAAARAWLAAGEKLCAAALLRRAAHRVLRASGWAIRLDILSELAPLIAEAGDLDLARRLNTKAAATRRRRHWEPGCDEELELVAIRAWGGDLEKAREMADGITDTHWRDHALATVARAAGAARCWDAAVEAASRIDKDTLRAPMLAAVSGRMAAAGEFGRAEEVVRAVPVADVRVGCLLRVARSLEAAGDNEGAAALALQAVATAAEAREDIELARTAIEAIQLCARTGRAEDAVRAVESINDPQVQGAALAAVAEVCEPPRRPSLVVRALAAGHWALSLAAMAGTHFELLMDVATEYAVRSGIDLTEPPPK